MVSPNQQPIALISVHGDPDVEIGKEEAGGQNVYVRQVGENLAKLGWQVDMFTRKSLGDQPDIVEHCANCRTIRLNVGIPDFVPRDEVFEYLPNFVNEWLKFQDKQGIQYRLLHTNYWLSGWVGMQLKKALSLKQVHTYHSLGAIKYQTVADIPKIASTRLAVEKECLETVDRVIATSPQEQKYLRQFVSEQGSIEIIPCGTDIQRFGKISKQQARQLLKIPADVKVVFYVGRFDPRKGIETLVRAMGYSQFRHPSQVRLIIGGGSRPGYADGQERDRIEALIQELGLSDITTFTGRILDEELPLYYTAADVCVVPSHYEPFGLVAIEAMACRTPVIASDVGGLQFTVIPEATGILCPPKDEVAFAEAIDRILMNPVWQKQMGEAARQRVKTEFSWEGVAIHLSQLYQQILS